MVVSGFEETRVVIVKQRFFVQGNIIPGFDVMKLFNQILGSVIFGFCFHFCGTAFMTTMGRWKFMWKKWWYTPTSFPNSLCSQVTQLYSLLDPALQSWLLNLWIRWWDYGRFFIVPFQFDMDYDVVKLFVSTLLDEKLNLFLNLNSISERTM